MIDPTKFIRDNIRRLVPYSTARDEFKGGEISVWIDANENPYDNGLNRYPDPRHKAVKQAIGRLKGIAPEYIFVGGAGSDEAIDLTFRIFCEPGKDNAVAIAPSYGVYGVAAAINDVELRQVQLCDDFSLPVSRLLKATDRHTKLMLICSPNNPTANSFHKSDILKLVEDFEGIVVVDEAYVDFSDEGSLIGEIDRHPNLIVLQTFSKAWGLASLRVGMAFAVPAIAEVYGMVKYPYNVNGPTQKEILRQIGRDIHAQIDEIKSEREMLSTELATFPFVRKVFHSDANFLLVKVDKPDDLYDFLVAHGVIVRNRSRMIMCEGTLRITVGTPEENRLLLKLFKRYGDVGKQ